MNLQELDDDNSKDSPKNSRFSIPKYEGRSTEVISTKGSDAMNALLEKKNKNKGMGAANDSDDEIEAKLGDDGQPVMSSKFANENVMAKSNLR
jgi:hypothetical protein